MTSQRETVMNDRRSRRTRHMLLAVALLLPAGILPAFAAHSEGTSALTLGSPIGFGPAAVADLQRASSEPQLQVTPAGDTWIAGNDFLLDGIFDRSTDGGQTYHSINPDQAGTIDPTAADVAMAYDDQGTEYANDGAPAQCAVSNDRGRTWRNSLTCTEGNYGEGDRQWLVVDNGLTPAADDNTVFLISQAPAENALLPSDHIVNGPPWDTVLLASPGSAGPTDPVGGLVFTQAGPVPPATDDLTPQRGEWPCMELRWDPRTRTLYYPCYRYADTAGTRFVDRMTVFTAHVAPGQRTNIRFTAHELPAIPAAGNPPLIPQLDGALSFPIGFSLAIDAAGTVYASWSDLADAHVYYSYSKDQARSWSTPQRVDPAGVRLTAWAWSRAGAPGRLAIAFWGNTTAPATAHSSYDLPNWYTKQREALEQPWWGYATVITNADTAQPVSHLSRFSDTPLHYGEVCQNNNNCFTASTVPIGGDVSVYDFFSFDVDRHGALLIPFDDTTNQFHSAQLYVARQDSGPSLLGGSLGEPPHDGDTSGVGDAVGDAEQAQPGVPPGAPTVSDLTGVQLSRPNPSTLEIRMTVADGTIPTGSGGFEWVTRFNALSVPASGLESHRIFYAGVTVSPTGHLSYFAGSGDGGDGCVMKESYCVLLRYPQETSVSGHRDGNTFVIDVPVDGGFGADRPITGDTLDRVTAFTAADSGTAGSLFTELDLTRPFDYRFQ